MTQFVIPGPLGSTDARNRFSRPADENASQNKRDFVGRGQAPGPVGERDDDWNETQRLKSRFPEPASPHPDKQRYKSAKERLELEGYQSDNWVLPGYHLYTVETVICRIGEAGCSAEAVFEQLKRFPAPQRFGSPDRKVGVKTGDKSFALGVGMVEHWVGTRLLTNTTTENQHLLNPGVVIREVVVAGDSIIVKTSGFGNGLLPQINSGIAAKLIWSDRTDNKIKAALGIKDKK